MDLSYSGDLRWTYKVKGERSHPHSFPSMKNPEPHFSVFLDHSWILRILTWLILWSGYKYPSSEYGFVKET